MIKLETHNPLLKDVFNDEQRAILDIIPMAEVYHVGSTAIKNCQTKPIIDIVRCSLWIKILFKI